MEIQIQFFSSLMQSNFSSTYQQESQKLKISKVSDYSLLSISVYVFTVNSPTKFHPILVFLILISYEKVLEVKFNKKAMKHNAKYILTNTFWLENPHFFSDFCMTSITELFAYIVLDFSDFPHIKSLKDYLIRKM